MSKINTCILVLAIFLLIGTSSFAMGAASDTSNTSNNTSNILFEKSAANAIPEGLFTATINFVAADNLKQISETVSGASLTLTVNNQQTNVGFVPIRPGAEESNMYTTLSSAAAAGKPVIVFIENVDNNKYITQVRLAK